MEERNYYVYQHIVPDGRRYIGTTKMKPSKRWCKSGYRGVFGKAIEEFGWENISHEIIVDRLTEKEAFQMEKELIAQFNTTDLRYGFNVSKGGKGPLGVKQNRTDNWNKNISKGRTGVRLSKENRKKLSLAKIGKKVGGKVVLQFDFNGNLIAEYESLLSAEEKTGILHSNISMCCQGSRRQAGGFIWKYKDDCKDFGDVKLRKKYYKKSIVQMSMNYEFISKHDTCVEAAIYVFGEEKKKKSIYNALSSKTHVALGYKWMRYEDYINLCKIGCTDILSPEQ